MKIIVSSLLLLLCSIAYSQNGKKRALDSFNKSEWQDAKERYAAYFSKSEGDSLDHYNYAYALYETGNYELSLAQFNSALEKNFSYSLVYLGMSKCYAQLGNKREMLNNLSKAAAQGLTKYKEVAEDPAFALYSSDVGFKTMLSRMKANVYPCLGDRNYRHFDFWLGEWEVFVDGNKIGENSVTMAVGGCAIHESYTTENNYSGQSINFYDPIDKKWHQHWVGSGQDVYNYVEIGKKQGMLQFQSPFYNPANGQMALSRLTFTLNPDGTVRQFFETSIDDGQTWIPGFDGLYKKKQ